MNKLDYFVVGTLLGYFAYPIINVIKLIFKNAYIEYKKAKENK